MRELPITIIYASASGNVEYTCEKIAEVFTGHHLVPQLVRAEVCDPTVLISGNLFILATSTWEHGEINPYFNKLLGEMDHLDLKHKYAGFVGLGDKSYEEVLFCQGVEILRTAFHKAGGTELYSVLKLNGEPYHQVDDQIKPWAHGFISELIHLPEYREEVVYAG